MGEARLIGTESDKARSHKLRVEHEEGLDFPGKKSSITSFKNGPFWSKTVRHMHFLVI